MTSNCFAAGTLVATSAGLLPIEQVEAGDQVYAYDDATGKEHLAEVVALHHRDVEATWTPTRYCPACHVRALTAKGKVRFSLRDSSDGLRSGRDR